MRCEACEADGDDREAVAGGLCTMHYQRHHKSGSTALSRKHGHRPLADPIVRYWNKVDQRGPNECWLWTGSLTKKGGYGQMTVKEDGNWRTVRATRWGYEHLIGPITEAEKVCHTCDNPPCQNPAHWFLGTTADNSADMVAKDRQVRGERNHHARLTDSDVLAIRSRIGEDHSILAVEFRVTKPSIANIIYGRTWKHLL